MLTNVERVMLPEMKNKIIRRGSLDLGSTPPIMLVLSLPSCKSARSCRPNDCTKCTCKLRTTCKHALTWPVMMTSQRTISRTGQTVTMCKRTDMSRRFTCFHI